MCSYNYIPTRRRCYFAIHLLAKRSIRMRRYHYYQLYIHAMLRNALAAYNIYIYGIGTRRLCGLQCLEKGFAAITPFRYRNHHVNLTDGNRIARIIYNSFEIYTYVYTSVGELFLYARIMHRLTISRDEVHFVQPSSLARSFIYLLSLSFVRHAASWAALYLPLPLPRLFFFISAAHSPFCSPFSLFHLSSRALL